MSLGFSVWFVVCSEKRGWRPAAQRRRFFEDVFGIATEDGLALRVVEIRA